MLYIEQLLEHPFLNLIVAIGLIAIGIEELYKEGVLQASLHWKHGMSLYGLFVLIQSLVKIAKGSVKLYKGNLSKH